MNQENTERANNDGTKNNSATGSVITASVMTDPKGDGDAAAYSMFEAREISANGAFLVGSLFLELNEEFTVELALGGGQVRARAKVAAIARGDLPGMTVEFSDLSDGDRALLEAQANEAAGD